MLLLRKTLRAALGALALASCAAALPSVPEAQAAGSPYLEVVDPGEAMRSPAYRYANMSNEDAFAELDRRHILYTKQAATLGVRAPVRLTGRLHGVHVHSSLPPEQRPSTPFEILDARLALALDDFCAILARHDVDEIIHYTMYRPNVPPPGYVARVASPAEKAEPARPQEPAEPRTVNRSAKKKPAGKTTLAKGERTGKGAAPPSTKKRTGDRRKDAYGADLDGGPSLDDVSTEKLGAGAHDVLLDDDVDPDLVIDREHGKTAPKGKPVPAGKGSNGGGSGSGKSGASTAPAPRPTAIGSTSRRTAGALRRPPVKADENEADHTHGKWAPPGTRHPAGLAIDLGAVHKRDGRWLSIASHFGGKIGQKTCGAGAPIPEGSDAKELRAIVCEAREAGVFTYALTPNFNQDHVDHVHFEIKPGVTWFLYH